MADDSLWCDMRFGCLDRTFDFGFSGSPVIGINDRVCGMVCASNPKTGISWMLNGFYIKDAVDEYTENSRVWWEARELSSATTEP